MVVPFSQLSSLARIWIYPSDRAFREEEIPKIEEILTSFLSQWTAHDVSLETSFELPYDRFIVLGVNQETAQASGCSIDSSVRMIQQLETQFEISLLDKMNVTFKQGQYFVHKDLSDFRKMAKTRVVTKETIVFNNLVDTKSDYEKFWEIPASESWHNRFMK
ncbi:MAG: hypothetical protein ACI9TK_000352 [Flavobacteriaceae bacterium]|jgi:hypothetical protein|tara:strand:- start:6600 stop:7085 length:486 start_codon:yes stop_codon:yes gene_type:complete